MAGGLSYVTTMSPFAAELAACRAAQEPWSRLPVRDRLRPVRELRHLLVERADEISAAVAEDIARPAAEVLAIDLLPTAASLILSLKCSSSDGTQSSSKMAALARTNVTVSPTHGAV